MTRPAPRHRAVPVKRRPSPAARRATAAALASVTLAGTLAIGVAPVAGAAAATCAGPKPTPTATCVTKTTPVTTTSKVTKTRTVTRYRTVTRTRTVTKTRKVVADKVQVRTTANVNLRKSTTTASKSLKVLKKGTVVRAGAVKGSWRKTTVGKSTGWVAKRYLKSSRIKVTTAQKYRVKQKVKVKQPYQVKEKYTVTQKKTVNKVTHVWVKAVAPKTFAIEGSGWGHGVGMSQYGAKARAAQGQSARTILEHYYAGAELTSASGNPAQDIRVQLLRTSSVRPTVANGQWRLVATGKLDAVRSYRDPKTKKTLTQKSTVAAGATLPGSSASSAATVTVAGGKLRVSYGEYVVTAQASSAGVTVQWQNTRAWTAMSPTADKNTVVSVPRADDGAGTVGYRHGVIELSVLGGQVNVVNKLRLNDEYLYGLAEMPSSWPDAALQAQAVAGRTYALKQMGPLKKACGCNVYDEVASQKYTGWNKENEGATAQYGKRWQAAVNATLERTGSTPTSGQVITYKGTLIDAVYFSSSGGATRSGQSVWGTATPYLVSVDDALGEHRAWSTTASQAVMAKAFGLDGRGGAGILKVTLKKNKDLTLASATATTLDGRTVTVTGAQFRSVVPTTSAWVTGISKAS